MNAQPRYSPSLTPPDEPDFGALHDRVCSDTNIQKLAVRLCTHAPWVSCRLGNNEAFCNQVAKAIADFHDPYWLVICEAREEARRLLSMAATRYAERPNYNDGADEPDADSIDLEDAC